MSRDATLPPLVPLRREDVPALVTLMQAIEEHEVFERPVREADVRELLTLAGLDLARDTLAVWEGERLLAFGVVEMRSARDHHGRARGVLIGGVHPQARRRGIGTALVEAGERIAARIAAERLPGAPVLMRMDGGFDPRDDGDPGTGVAPPAPGDPGPGIAPPAPGDPGTGVASPAPGGAGAGIAPRAPGGTDIRPLLDAHSYRRVRSFLEMVRPLPGGALEHPAPEDITLRSPGPEHVEPVREAHNAAFADHWGSAPTDAARWHDLWTSHAARPDLAGVALDGTGTVLAYTFTTIDAPGELHVQLVGTRAEGRGRGLARAVLAHSLTAAAADGLTRAKLEVDADSLTGATRLYEGLGFTLHRTSSLYEKTLS